ncbi:MAG: hypothetical protein J0H68_09290 [Sphingobacteriia bacterium]|nr:hypothetical protein [Sphingobacteriia bacterium]
MTEESNNKDPFIEKCHIYFKLGSWAILVLIFAIMVLSSLYKKRANIITTVKVGNVLPCLIQTEYDCYNKLNEHIDNAINTIYVQANYFSYKEIFNSLVKAANRGVKVKMLFDASRIRDERSIYQEALHSPIQTFVYHAVKSRKFRRYYLPLNKVIIIDERYVITGTFNLAPSHYHDVDMIIIDDTSAAMEYLKAWNYYHSKVPLIDLHN